VQKKREQLERRAARGENWLYPKRGGSWREREKREREREREREGRERKLFKEFKEFWFAL
jgi:hypothetical protein